MRSTLRYWAPLLALAAAACDQTAPPAPVATNVQTEPATLTLTDNTVAEVPIEVPPDRVTLGGTVISTTPSRLFLDYDTGQITIDLGEWRTFREGQLIHPGDRILVAGHMDADFFAHRTLKARSLYVAPLDTSFFLEGAAAEDLGPGSLGRAETPVNIRYSGIVTEASRAGFAFGADAARLPVDTSALESNPLDDEGYQRIVPGERVVVWGVRGPGDDGRPRILARGVATLRPDAAAEPPAAPAAAMPDNSQSAD